LAVNEVEASKRFYTDLFEQKVVLDLGWNVTFSGGFAVQQNFAWLVGLPEDTVVEKSNNMELYFEVDGKGHLHSAAPYDNYHNPGSSRCPYFSDRGPWLPDCDPPMGYAHSLIPSKNTLIHLLIS
jgi:catechol 2,3-dioxygenase-like lactoylglutathione lyase family enzyme